MAKIIGQEVEVAITKEVTRGTPPAAIAGDWLERGNLSIGRTKETVDVDANVGVKVTKRDNKVTQFENEITVEMPMERRHVGLFLMAVYGSVSTSADTPEAGVQTHDYSILDTRLVPTYTISVIDANSRQHTYSLGLLTKMTVTLVPDALPLISVTFLTKKRATTAALTSAYSATSYFSPEDISVFMPLTYADLAAANAIDIIEATIEWSIDEAVKHKYLGSDTHSDISGASFEVTSHIVKHQDEETFKAGDVEYIDDDFEAHQTRALRILLTDTDETIGAATNPSVRVEIPAGKIQEYDPKQDLKDVVGEEFDFVPVNTDTSNGYSIAQVINTVTAY